METIVDSDFYDLMEKKFEALSDEEKKQKMAICFDRTHIFRKVPHHKKEEKIAACLGIRHKILREKYFEIFKQVWREKRMLFMLDRPMSMARAIKRMEKKVENMINKFLIDEDITEDLSYLCGHDKQVEAEVSQELKKLEAKWLLYGGDNEDIAFEDMMKLGKLEQETVNSIKKIARNSIYEYCNQIQRY